MCVCARVCIYIIEVWEWNKKIRNEKKHLIFSWRQNYFLNSSHKKELKSERDITSEKSQNTSLLNNKAI